MLLALLIGMWQWDRVVSDCHGNPERIHHYYFQATMRQNAWGTCPDPVKPNQTIPCMLFVPAAPVAFGPNIGDPGTGTVAYTWIDPVKTPNLLPLPPVGGLAIWPFATADNPNPVVAVDDAGNKCSDTCQ